MELDALKDLQSGVFSNTSAVVNAISSPDGAARYGTGVINLLTNAVHPAAFAQISRAQLPYYTKAKADTFYEEVKNNMLSRSSWLRKLTDQYPPSKINIWGEPMMKQGNTVQRLFGMTKSDKDNFAQPIYEDYKRTNNTKFFPPSVKPSIEVDGMTFNLNAAQSAELEMYVGQARKNLAAPYFNNMAVFEGENKTYEQLESDEEKTDKLRILYEEGYKTGEAMFLKAHPEYNYTQPKSEKDEKKEDTKQNKKFRKSVQSEAEKISSDQIKAQQKALQKNLQNF
jgi:hypothetical protein